MNERDPYADLTDEQIDAGIDALHAAYDKATCAHVQCNARPAREDMGVLWRGIPLCREHHEWLMREGEIRRGPMYEGVDL